jgi:hypothetical protein
LRQSHNQLLNNADRGVALLEATHSSKKRALAVPVVMEEEEQEEEEQEEVGKEEGGSGVAEGIGGGKEPQSSPAHSCNLCDWTPPCPATRR